MPKIKEHIQTIKQEAADTQKEHTRKEQLENLVTLYGLMAQYGPDAEINLEDRSFVSGKSDIHDDGVLSDLMKDMNEGQLLDAIKAPENFLRTLNKDYEKNAQANRKEKRHQKYLDIKQKFVEKFDKNRKLLMDVYGPEGKMPTNATTDQETIDEYNSIKLDVPEGMDKKTAMCIILGCCFDKKNLVKADPELANADPHSIHFAQNHMVDDLLLGDDSPSPSAKAMLEGKKEAQKVFEAYRNHNKAPAIAKLNNVILHENHSIGNTYVITPGNPSGKLYPSSTLTMMVPEIIEKNKDLGLDYNIGKPTNTSGIRVASLYNQLEAGKANEAAKIDLGNNFFQMKPAEKEEKTAEMLLNGYVSRMAAVQSFERDRITNKLFKDIAVSIGKDDLNRTHNKLNSECSAYQNALTDFTISDFDVIMSKPDGMDKIRELYKDKIKETDIYKKIVGAKDRDQLFDALKESDSAVDPGLTSFKDIRLPDVSSKFNNEHKDKPGFAEQALYDNVIRIVFSEKSLAAGDVDKYGLNSLDPEALKKNSHHIDQIYEEMIGLSTEDEPEQFTAFMQVLKYCKKTVKSFSKLERDLCKKEVDTYVSLVSSAVKEADKYLRECKNDNPERIKKTQMMKGRLIAIPMRSGDVANKAFMQKKKEVLGDRFKTFNYYSMDTQSIVFRGEKYKDSVPPSKHGFSTDRTANESIAMMVMAASEKYTLDDIMEPDRFVKEKQQIFDEVTKRLVRGNPEDQEWTARILHEGRKASEILVDDKARQIDFSKVDISNKEYCKLLQFGMIQFDAYQECSHCAAETLKIVNNDKTEDRPVFNDFNKYCIWCEKRLTALGDLCQGYNNIQEYAAGVMEDQVRPEESACSLLAESALIKYGEQKLAECQKKNSDKLFHEWYDGHLNIELKETRYKLAGENSRMLEDLQGDPKTTHALFGKLMDGTLLEPQTVNGKKNEGLTFSIDKDTFMVSFTGKPFTNQELKDIAFFSQPGDKILGQAIKDINTAKESVWFGSSEYKNAGNAMTELKKAYKAMNELPENASEEQKLQAYASVKEKSREVQQKIGLYFDRKTSQDLMNGNAAPKTQKRIDAMKLASSAAKKLEEDMKQMEAKLREDKLNARDAKEMEEKEKNRKHISAR